MLLTILTEFFSGGTRSFKVGDIVDFDKAQANTHIASGAATAVMTAPDSSATPGNVTHTTKKGRVAIPAGLSTVVVTNVNVKATSLVFVQVLGSDLTLTAARVTQSVGSFSITGLAVAAAATLVNYEIVD